MTINTTRQELEQKFYRLYGGSESYKNSTPEEMEEYINEFIEEQIETERRCGNELIIN